MMAKLRPAILFASIAFAGTAIAQTELPPPPGGPGGGMGVLMRADTDGDGIVTRAEAAAAADRQFDRIDANHDGRIDAAERAAARDAMRARRGDDAPPPPPAGDNRRGFGSEAGDKVVTRDAYRDRALARFDRADANHDGRVDRAEMAAMRDRRMAHRPPGGDGAPPPADRDAPPEQ